MRVPPHQVLRKIARSCPATAPAEDHIQPQPRIRNRSDFFVLAGNADCGSNRRMIGMSDGPIFDLQTGNLSEIDSIACDDNCAVGDGDGGYS
jgi:hypothetical protein